MSSESSTTSSSTNSRTKPYEQPARMFACPLCTFVSAEERAVLDHLSGYPTQRAHGDRGRGLEPVRVLVQREPAPAYPDPERHIAYELTLPRSVQKHAATLTLHARTSTWSLSLEGLRVRLYAPSDWTMQAWKDTIAVLVECGATIHAALRTHADASIDSWVNASNEYIGPSEASAFGDLEPRTLRAASSAPSGAFPAFVYFQIADERAKRDTQWDGPAYDDHWRSLRETYEDRIRVALARALSQMPGSTRDEARARARESMLKLAALTIAQIEALDRESEKSR